MPYIKHLPVETLREFLRYDPETGSITWIKRAAKNTIVGSPAGSVKGGSSSNSDYWYIRLHKIDFTAARAAWALTHGEWPAGKLFFVDGDPSNLKISNLRVANSLDDKARSAAEYMKRHREKFPDFWKDSHLQRNFGIGLTDYIQMVVERGNKCDICGQPETQMRGGKVKALAVDHNHTTGAVRGLLCSDCNTGLGKLGDSVDRLKAAIAYLDSHVVQSE
jgi:hypothetical protein